MSVRAAVPRIGIQLQWKPPSDTGNVAWHREQPNLEDTSLIGGQRVYCWLMRAADGSSESVYIGESGDFPERLRNYRYRVQKQNDKDELVKAMGKCESRGGTVELQFLDLDSCGFYLNETLLDQQSLRNHEVRLMMESIAIFMAKSANLQVINHLRGDAYWASILKITNGDESAAIDLMKRFLVERGYAL